jgi:hypothetical protein
MLATMEIEDFSFTMVCKAVYSLPAYAAPPLCSLLIHGGRRQRETIKAGATSNTIGSHFRCRLQP